MDWFKITSGYYPTYWTIEQVRVVVQKGKITPEQFKIITGENYTPGTV